MSRRQFVREAGAAAAGAMGFVAPLGALARSGGHSAKRDPTKSAQPIDFQRSGTFDGIIDIYVDNSEVDLEEARRLGVRAVIYRTSVGLIPSKDDRRPYHAAKERARQLGLLWGAYHVVSGEDVERQLTHFLQIEDGSDQRTLMALDWERTSKGTATLRQMRDIVGKFVSSRKYYPVIYGGNVLFENCARQRDELLAKCPLWYIDILTQKRPSLNLPKATWSDYALWQYATEQRLHGYPYPPNVLPGADWSRYKGTAEDLRRAWPLRVPA